MKDYILPLIPIIVPIISALFSLYQQRKVQNSGFLDEQYRDFISPIYYLLNSSYTFCYIISKVEHIFEEKPYLIPDGFLDDFSKFKSDFEKIKSVSETDFYKCVKRLYTYLRYQLKYSKKKLNYADKKSAKKYFGIRPTLLGVFLISAFMSISALIIMFPVTYFYKTYFITKNLYYFLISIISILILILSLHFMNKYYFESK